ncbi:MAG: hypothetical protein HY521_10000 [Proteobacteria bacterium]|nr:hypothetical protein [Pseudomonadota bacterium]
MTAITFAEILAPMTPEEFFAEYYDKKPLHIRGAPEKFARVMSWAELNRLLNMTGIWSSASLKMVLDRAPIPADQYCRQAEDRDHRPVLQPDAGKMLALLRRGASLVLNDIDSLSAGLSAVSGALEGALGSKAQANLYCSWREHQAFPAHFDTHDVFAVHVEGEKTWNVYEGRADGPIAHPVFRTLGQAHHDRAKGAVQFEARLKPGDLLYLPRGQYHDALATGDNAIHVAFGLHAPLGLDFLNLMYERAVRESLFRSAMPRLDAPGAEAALKERLAALTKRFAEMAAEPAVFEQFQAFLRTHRFARGGFDLPDLGAGEAGASPAYAVQAAGLKVVRRGQEFAIKAANGMIPIPPGGEGLVEWVFARPRFTEAELDAAFAAMPAAARAKMLAGLMEMKIVRKT